MTAAAESRNFEKFEKCNLCDIPLRSFLTHHLSDYYFCRDCYTSIVYPYIEVTMNTLMEMLSGNKVAQSRFAESLAFGAESRIVLGIARVGKAKGSIERLVPLPGDELTREESESQSDSGDEGEDRLPHPTDQDPTT